MKEKKLSKFNIGTVIQSRERRNIRIGNKLLRKPNVDLVLDLLALNEKIVDQMSTEELDIHRDKIETFRGICDYYGDPDFSLLDRDDLSRIVQKYLNDPEIQVKSLTNALLWNLIYLNIRTTRQNNNFFIILLGEIFRIKKIIELLDRTKRFERVRNELEKDTYDRSNLKQILKPFIDNTELPSLTTQLLEINHGNEKEKIEKLCNQATQKWVNKNPMPEALEGYSDSLYNRDDKFFENRKKISEYLIHGEKLS